MADLSTNPLSASHHGLRDLNARYSAIEHERTAWGYRLVARNIVARVAPLLERLALAGAVASVAGMAGMWFLPGSSLAVDLVGIKALMGVALGLTAIALFHLSARGLAREVQVDLDREEVRVVWRNRKDHFQLASVVGFDEVSSLYVKRSILPAGIARLGLRYDGGKQTVALVRGGNEEMQLLRQRLHWDIRHDAAQASADVDEGAEVARGAIRHRVVL
ncbi:hypothetical protein [Celeribacter sp.]|uniref:hypothetical protein n=1 Tax=Celeribacter sp. TaxID=1890673 RepID=UPI003A955403